MFQIDDDMTIYITRGDTAYFSVMAENDGVKYKFQPGDVVRMKVTVKKDCTNVAFQKDFAVTKESERVDILLTEKETKIGDVISKPVDYWYEIELNPYTNPQTIVGYDDDGAKILKLFPEGRDLGTDTVPEDVPVVDAELSLTSQRPVENQAVARAIVKLSDDVKNEVGSHAEALAKVEAEVEEAINKTYAETAKVSHEIAVERARITNLAKLEEGSTTGDAELSDARVGADGVTYGNLGEANRTQFANLKNDLSEVVMNNPKLNLITEKFRGYLGEDDVWVQSYRQYEMHSDFIDVIPGESYTLSIHYPSTDIIYGGMPSWCAISTYDASGAIIERVAKNVTDIDFVWVFVPGDNVSKVRVMWRNYLECSVKFEHSTYETPHEKAENKNGSLISLDCVGYYGGNGVLSGDGEGEEHNKTCYSLPIRVSPGEKYVLYNETISKDAWCAVSFFDGTGGHLTRETYTQQNSGREIYITIPEDCYYIAFSARTAYISDFAVYKDELESCDGQKLREVQLSVMNMNAIDTPTEVKGIAHAGLSLEAPQNTLVAFKKAAQKGFKYVECDVQFTSDNVPVLLHDEMIDGTSNGTGAISSMTYAQVSQYDFGSWFSSEYAGTKIPKLEEFLILCRNLGLHAYIELKTGDATQVGIVVDMVKRCGMKGRVTYISFEESCLTAVKNIDGSARLGFVTNHPAGYPVFIEVCNRLKTQANDVFVNTCRYDIPEIIELCINANLPVEAWTINDEEVIKGLHPYISGVTSDKLIASEVLYDYSIGV